MEHYKVNSPNGAFQFGATVHHVDVSRDTVRLGARKTRCVIISVYLPHEEDDDEEKEDNSLAHIDQMPRTTGTFQMIMTAVH